jgi:hypothetical protein
MWFFRALLRFSCNRQWVGYLAWCNHPSYSPMSLCKCQNACFGHGRQRAHLLPLTTSSCWMQCGYYLSNWVSGSNSYLNNWWVVEEHVCSLATRHSNNWQGQWIREGKKKYLDGSCAGLHGSFFTLFEVMWSESITKPIRSLDSPFAFKWVTGESAVIQMMENSAKELYVMVLWWGEGFNIINMHISCINARYDISITAWAMSGEHFKPIGKCAYLYFLKEVVMLQRFKLSPSSSWV